MAAVATTNGEWAPRSLVCPSTTYDNTKPQPLSRERGNIVWAKPKCLERLLLNYSSPLHRFIEEWIASRHTNWDWLTTQAGVQGSLGTGLKRGSTPRPETLRKLASTMEVPRRKLFELAGYLEPEDLEPENIEIDDPEISMFFRKYEWDEFTSDERELIRLGIRMALQARAARAQAVEGEA